MKKTERDFRELRLRLDSHQISLVTEIHGSVDRQFFREPRKFEVHPKTGL